MKSILFGLLSVSSISMLGMGCTVEADSDCQDSQVELYEKGSETPKCMALPKACKGTPSCSDQECETAMYQFCTSANVACSDDGQGHAAITCN